MNLKGVILGMTGALAASGAFAADLPAAPEPVDYVRVCDAFGTGYFYIPGTETCIRISGLVRTEFSTNFLDDELGSGMSWDSNSAAGYNFYARGRLNVDTRTNTEFGLLRTFFRYEMTRQTTNSGNSTNLPYAIVQFGGLTVGRTDSYFTGIFVPTIGAIFETSQPDYATNLAAYTMGFAEGFSATLSIEDAAYSKLGIATPFTAGARSEATSVAPKMPDIVLSLNVDQGWGSAKVMGALHQVQSRGYGGGGTWRSGTKPKSQDELGWGIGAGAAINLPMLAEGDQFTILGVYSQGYSSAVLNYGLDGRLTSSGSLELANAWAINAGFVHFWTPQISSALAASYLDVSNMARNDLTRWDIQGDLAYTPVDGLSFIGELAYAQVDTKANTDLDGGEALVGTLRVERSF